MEDRTDSTATTFARRARGIAAIITRGERANAREWLHLDTGDNTPGDNGASVCAEVGAIITRADLAQVAAEKLGQSRARVTAAEIDLAMTCGAYALAALRSLVLDTLAMNLATMAEAERIPPEIAARHRNLADRLARSLEATAEHAPNLVPANDPAAAEVAERDMGSRILNALCASAAPPERHNDYTGLARCIALNAAAEYLLRDGGPALLEQIAAAARSAEDEGTA